MLFLASRMCGRPVPRTGVTLVELLVVIAIIGLLVGLAKAARKAEVGVTRVLKGGYELEWHWNEGVATAAIEGTEFDIVVLQARSQKPCERALPRRESPEGLPATLTPAEFTPNPEGLPSGETVSVPPDDAAFMQTVVWQTAETWRKKTRAWYLNPRGL